MSEPELRQGSVAAELGAELPGLSLDWLEVAGGNGRSPRDVRERLRRLADRIGGAQAINLRHQAIPHAYRVFFRHIGLDPDQQRTPVEAAVVERMRRGGFASGGLVQDALTIAIVETGVALRAFDADRVEGTLGIRPSLPGEALEGRPGELPPGTLVIADERRPLALLFGALAAGRRVERRTVRTLLCAITVAGVPRIAVEEALWLASGIVQG